MLLGGLRLKKFILYLIRWQLSTPILFICLSFLHLGTFWDTIISNFIGGCIFFFVDKKIFVQDFNLTDNPDSKDKDIDFENSIKIYESLKSVPNFILCDDRFWLWLHLDKFYTIVRKMMKINCLLN